MQSKKSMDMNVLILLTVAICGRAAGNRESFVNNAQTTLLQFDADLRGGVPRCHHYKSREEVQKNRQNENVHVITDVLLLALTPFCMLLQTFHSTLLSALKIPFPGTKWCGIGSIATGFDDLGPFGAADSCCRHHDHCPETITSGKTKHGLTNRGFGTISHCTCDTQFRNCLKEKGDQAADVIGLLFFNILRMKCFAPAHQAPNCTHQPSVDPTCGGPSDEESKAKEPYQLFDTPRYLVLF